MHDDAPLLCARCLKTLTAGRGEFYVVSIRAVADPTPPAFEEADVALDLHADWRDTVAALRDVSAQEALDQVYRQVILHLCNACYREWIENPAG